MTDISEYSLTAKRMIGRNIKLFFKKSNEKSPTKVLALTNVAAFIDNWSDQNLVSLYIRAAGSYGTDMAMQLKRPEVENFKEVFIYTDKASMNAVFRSLSESAVWRDFDNAVLGDTNY